MELMTKGDQNVEVFESVVSSREKSRADVPRAVSIHSIEAIEGRPWITGTTLRHFYLRATWYFLISLSVFRYHSICSKVLYTNRYHMCGGIVSKMKIFRRNKKKKYIFRSLFDLNQISWQTGTGMIPKWDPVCISNTVRLERAASEA